jgi:hypothetical protein
MQSCKQPEKHGITVDTYISKFETGNHMPIIAKEFFNLSWPTMRA